MMLSLTSKFRFLLISDSTLLEQLFSLSSMISSMSLRDCFKMRMAMELFWFSAMPFSLLIWDMFSLYRLRVSMFYFRNSSISFWEFSPELYSSIKNIECLSRSLSTNCLSNDIHQNFWKCQLLHWHFSFVLLLYLFFSHYVRNAQIFSSFYWLQ